MLAKLKVSSLWDQTFLFLMGLGIIVSMQMAWTPGFFHDGYLYAAFGKNAAEQGKWLVPHLSDYAYPRFEQHLPTFFILEGLFFKVFGSSFVTARIFVSLFFLITGMGLYRWCRNKEGRVFSYYALFFFFIIPPLMKKVRFPNLDIPLMCTIFWGFYFYSKARMISSWKNWLLVGFFFGASLLIKGPMGALLPIGIVSHFVLSKDFKILATVKSWGGLFFGFLIFGLWPLSLYLTNNFDIFLDWYKFTFVITIGKSRSVGEPFYTYFWFLLKQTPIWMILTFIAVYKERKNEKFILPFAFFIGILFFLSVPKFKYSNYLMPLYPYLGICTAYGFKNLGDRFFKSTHKGFVGLSFVAALILLIFPLTTESKRDRGLHQFKDVLHYSQVKPEHWLNVSCIYSGIALSSINAFESGTPTSCPHIKDLLGKKEDYFMKKVLVVGNSESDELKRKFSKLKVVAIIKNYNVMVLMHSDTFFVSRPLNL